jgi:hypothetical protein
MARAIAWTALQPEQCAGRTRPTRAARNASTVGSMRASNSPPVRCRPPRRPVGHPLDLPGDQNCAIEQQAVRALLDHLKPLGLKVVTARRRQSQLTAGGKGDSPFAPSIGVDHQRQPRAPATADQALEATMMIGVAVRDDDRTQLTQRHLKHVEVAGHCVRGETRVVEHSAPVAVLLDADQRGETMLSNQLLSRAEVPRLVASHALLAGHQHVEEVVDHDRHLDAINRGEHTPILRQRPTHANEAHKL